MKILYVTTISLTMNSFFKPHIEMLVQEGHQVDIACNDSDLPLDNLYEKLGCKAYRVLFSRSPLSADNIKAYGQLKKIVENGSYDIVHCHTPNAAVITRLVCRKLRRRTGLKVFYTAHGFHFYKGAPKLNWLVFYPVEKFCSRFTDKLITINREDYTLAKNKFHAGSVHYVPGVGIDLSRFENIQVDRAAKRREIGVPEDAFLLLSVGELNENKNHQVIVRALARLHNPDVHYAIAGLGEKKEELLSLARELGVSEQLHILGYRKDIPELNHAADVFCFPSLREGLSVSVIEAMACGLPIVSSRIRGNTDLVCQEGGALFDPRCVDDCQQAITRVLNGELCQMGRINQENADGYTLGRVLDKVKSIYGGRMIKEMYTPKISIVIPAYNASNYLAEAIDSALTQTYPNVEIIVVNDGSRDDGATERIALSYGDKIRYFSKENGGSSSALNMGIANMTGEWFSWLSHDDLYLPEKLEKQVAYINELGIADSPALSRNIFFSYWGFIDAAGKEIKIKNQGEMLAQRLRAVPHNGYLIAEPTVYIFHGCSCLIHRDALADVGCFDEKLRLLNDVDLWYRLYAAEYKVHFLPEVLVKGRVHAAQVSRSIGFSYHNPEQDLYWNRSLDWLLENYPEEEELFFLFGRNAYLKTRSAEGDRAFAHIRSAPVRKAVLKTVYKTRAVAKESAKKIYLKLKG